MLDVLPNRECLLSFSYENFEGEFKPAAVLISGIEAFRCTYLTSLTVEMIESAYDRLVDMGESQWLREVKSAGDSSRHSASLKHLRICFDDGPCYEFICVAFRI